MPKRQPSDPIPLYLSPPRDDEDVETVLMSDEGSEDVFDDLRQRYERQVEAVGYELLQGQDPRPIMEREEPDVSIEPLPPEPVAEPDVPWYAWLMLTASLVMLGVTAIVVVMLLL